MGQSKETSAKLVLEDGSEWPGVAFGKRRSGAGEVVFTTAMTGYPQALTDPSFRGQIIVSTYPMLGNYGLPVRRKTLLPFLDGQNIPVHFESDRVQASGLIVQELCDAPSHFSSTATLSAWLDKNAVPGISGIDTRALTKRLRESGVMRGKILVEGEPGITFEDGVSEHPVADVSCREAQYLHPAVQSTRYKGRNGEPLRIAILDCGIKANILRCFMARGIEIIRLPWNHTLDGIAFDGLFISNGPGDPKACGVTIATVKRAFTMDKPIFGICLGVQLMALAAGADTYKLRYGHRAANQPCIDAETGLCCITSQNHGYAVRPERLRAGWDVWFTNANDNTVEGIKCRDKPFSAVQFHPEGCPGPRDSEYLIDNFLEQVQRSV
jgi:carbamoyl-phosphate synthase small subunit